MATETAARSGPSAGSGPVLVFSKTHLFMKNHTGKSETDEVTVTNIGSTAVFYEWKKNARGDFIKAKRSDGQVRFYCHYARGALKPGESQTFVFLFISDKAGMFTEEWDLRTEPLLVQSIPQLKMTGHAYTEEMFIAERYHLRRKLEDKAVWSTANEIVMDVVRRVRTPTPPPPDLLDPVQCQEQFEARNLKHEVWYTDHVISLLRHLEQAIYRRIPSEATYTQWDLSLDHMRELIKLVDDPYHKSALENQVNLAIKLAKVKPIARSRYTDLSGSVLDRVIKRIPALLNACRATSELDDVKFHRKFDMTPEELEKIRKEGADKDALKMKMVKGKKGKTMDEINAEKELSRNAGLVAINQEFARVVAATMLDEEEIEGWKHIQRLHEARVLPQILQNTTRLNKHQKNSNIAHNIIAQGQVARLHQDIMGSLSRKYALTAIDLEGKKVLARLNLQIPLTPIVWEEEKKEEPPKPPPVKKRPGAKEPPKPVEPPKEEAPPVFKLVPRQIADPRQLQAALVTVKYCLDHLAKVVIIMGNMGPRTGEYREEWSLKPIYDFLKGEIEQNIFFYDNVEIRDLEQRLEDLPENSIVMLENSAFHPGEFGYQVTKEGHVRHQTLQQTAQFRELLASYCEVFVNDCIGPTVCMETAFKDPCTLTNPGCSSIVVPAYGPVTAVMGKNLEPEIISITHMFQEPDRTLVTLLGVDASSAVSVIDKLVMAYSMLDLADVIAVGGEIALGFVRVKYGAAFSNPWNPALDRFVTMILDYATEKETDFLLPVDCLCARKPDPPPESPPIQAVPPVPPGPAAASSPPAVPADPLPPVEPPHDQPWPHYVADLTRVDLRTEEGRKVLESQFIVAWGPETMQLLERRLERCRTLFWCGGMDLFPTDRPELVPLNKGIVEFIHDKNDPEALKVGLMDAEAPFHHIVRLNNYHADVEEAEPDNAGSSAGEGENVSQVPSGAPPITESAGYLDTVVAHLFKAPLLTTAVLQGRRLPGLDLLTEHPKPKQKSAEDDTSYLDII